jgi:hypothetical protein
VACTQCLVKMYLGGEWELYLRAWYRSWLKAARKFIRSRRGLFIATAPRRVCCAGDSHLHTGRKQIGRVCRWEPPAQQTLRGAVRRAVWMRAEKDRFEARGERPAAEAVRGIAREQAAARAAVRATAKAAEDVAAAVL